VSGERGRGLVARAEGRERVVFRGVRVAVAVGGGRLTVVAVRSSEGGRQMDPVPSRVCRQQRTQVRITRWGRLLCNNQRTNTSFFLPRDAMYSTARY